MDMGSRRQHNHSRYTKRYLNSTSAPSIRASDYGLSLQSDSKTVKLRSTVGETFMSSSWRAAVHFKQHCVWNLLERSAAGAAILLVDGDVTLFRDPLPMLLAATAGRSNADLSTPHSAGASVSKLTRLSQRSTPRRLQQQHQQIAQHATVRPYDMAVMDDTTPRAEKRYLNSGFMLLRNTAATRAFGRAYLTQLQKRRSENDQAVFNDVLLSMSGAGGASGGGSRRGALRTLVLDSRVYLCGYFFYEYRDKRPLNATGVVAVHHNWIRGDRNKWERAVAYDAVVQDSNELKGHFLRRARSSMTRMHAWQYRNKAHPGNRPV